MATAAAAEQGAPLATATAAAAQCAPLSLAAVTWHPECGNDVQLDLAAVAEPVALSQMHRRAKTQRRVPMAGVPFFG